MSKVRFNGVADALQGRMGVVVFRRMHGKLFASNRPNESTKPLTEAQRNHRATFAKAAVKAREALGDPDARLRYERLAVARQTTAFGVAVADVFHPPEVVEIDYAGLTRQVGGRVKILARDDAEVKSVHVALRGSDGSVLEQGQAVLENTHWYYTSTTAIAPERPVMVEVNATDWAGNTDSQSAMQLGTFPVIDRIDVAGYHGQVGNPIVVHARDDVGVTSVEVLLRTAAGDVIENPATVRVGDTWRASATVAVPPGSTITVIASAFDAAGNDIVNELGVVVA